MTQDTSDVLTNPTPSSDPSPGEQPGQPIQDGSSSQDEIEQLKAEIAQLREQLARAQADYNNLVRRSREEQFQIGEWSENKTILKFLPILDNLERALEHTPEEFKWHVWTEGFRSIVVSMQKVLIELGMTKIDTLGREVNPDLHDVISQTPHVNTTIQTEVETGYMRGEKALRHAKVIVGDGSMPS